MYLVAVCPPCLHGLESYKQCGSVGKGEPFVGLTMSSCLHPGSLFPLQG